MVKRYSDFQRLHDAKRTAKANGCFVVELPQYNRSRERCGTKFLLYREAQPRNVLVGKRKSVDGIVSLVNSSIVGVESKPQRTERHKMTDAERDEAARIEYRKRLEDEFAKIRADEDRCDSIRDEEMSRYERSER